jgi:hypothetical protein
MISVLQSKGLYKFITTRAQILKDKAEVEEDLDKMEELLEGDEKALGLMKCHIVPSYTEVVVDCTTALDAWNKIEAFFAGKETFHKIHLLEQLIDGKLKETNNPARDVQEFVKEKNDLVRRLDAAGLKINEEIQVAIMLARLPQSYDTMRRILESSPQLSLLQLTAELNREAVRKSGHKRTSSEAAMVAASVEEPVPRAAKKRRTNDTRTIMRCNFCNKTRHVAANCWLNPDSAEFKPDLARQMLEIASRASAIQEQRNVPQG